MTRRAPAISGEDAALGNSGRTPVGEDYVIIAAMSSLLPMMFMTRVIL
jgi:hypothetical protein